MTKLQPPAEAADLVTMREFRPTAEDGAWNDVPSANGPEDYGLPDDIERSLSGTAADGKSLACRFLVRRFDEITLTRERRYLVKGLIPRAGLIVIWGPPKSGKSFWTFDLAMHIARGVPYQGRRVQQGAVIYVALEGSKGFEARIEAYRVFHGVVTAPFALITNPLNLVADRTVLAADIRAQIGDATPVAVVVDTLNRSLAGSESNDQDMSAYVRAADSLRDAFGCAVIVVHHCGIDASRPRGHTSLTGAADAQIAVKRDAARNIVAEVEWMKDGDSEGLAIVSRLEQVEVGTDEDGDPVTSCVIVPVDPDTVSAMPTRKLSPRHQLAFECLAALVTDHGRPAPEEFGLPAGIFVVEAAQWRQELHSRGIIDAEAANPRADYQRIRTALQIRHIIAERNGLVWIVRQ